MKENDSATWIAGACILDDRTKIKKTKVYLWSLLRVEEHTRARAHTHTHTLGIPYSQAASTRLQHEAAVQGL